MMKNKVTENKACKLLNRLQCTILLFAIVVLCISLTVFIFQQLS